MARSSRTTDDRGAAAVEMALVLPFLLVLVCGTIDFGRAYNAKVTLTHASREGVRVWALTQVEADAAERTRHSAIGLEDPDNGVDEVHVTTTACEFGKPTRLTATYEFTYITPLSGLLELLPGSGDSIASPVTLGATGVMRCGG